MSAAAFTDAAAIPSIGRVTYLVKLFPTFLAVSEIFSREILFF